MKLSAVLTPVFAIAISFAAFTPAAHAWGPIDGYTDGRENTYYGSGRVDVPAPRIELPDYYSYESYPAYQAYSSYPSYPSYRYRHHHHHRYMETPWYGWHEPQTTIIYERPTVTYVAPAPVAHIPPPPPSGAMDNSLSGMSTPPPDGRYYFCASSQLYYPNTPSCSERWKIVLASQVD